MRDRVNKEYLQRRRTRRTTDLLHNNNNDDDDSNSPETTTVSDSSTDADSGTNNTTDSREEDGPCVVIGMDGYHLTREQLKRKAANHDEFKVDNDDDDDGDFVDEEKSYRSLMKRRGAAFTYCPKQFIQDLRGLRDPDGTITTLPVYDREQHDPIANGVQIQQHHRLILVEGLYLLCLHDPDWAPLGDLWDDRWYIEVSMEETKRRLIQRHLKNWTDEKTKHWGGDDEAAAARKSEANDMKNAACIQRWSKPHAHLIIQNETIPEDDSHNADVTAASD